VKRKCIQVIIFLGCTFIAAAQESISKVWSPDLGNGFYKNPVINADYSDPDAIRVGNDFYLISSSFNHVPGLPILHSKDLVNWTLIGHALPRLVPDSNFRVVRHGGGVWAPSIRFHSGEFYIYYPDPDFGIYLVRSKNIMGPWSEPVLVIAGKGLIDPCPLWDDDGKVYLVHAFAGSRAGIKSILVIKQMNAEGTKTLDDGILVYDGHEKDPTIEGPKLYKRNNYYYIFAPAGGVSTGWQLVLRSKNIYGPYERKIVMDQGKSAVNGPHQGAWVNTSGGEDWFLHFQDREAYGRVVHLQPMHWINNWPVIGIDKEHHGIGEPVPEYKKPATGKSYTIKTIPDSDEFNTTKPGLQWQWQANPSPTWAMQSASGFLRMYGVYQPDSMVNLWNVPNILAQKIPAEEFTLKVKIRFSPFHVGDRFGIVMLGADYAGLSIEKTEKGLTISYIENLQADQKNNQQQGSSYPLLNNEIIMEMVLSKGGICRFGFEDMQGNYTAIPSTFVMKPGRWVGAKMGMYMLSRSQTNDAGYADIDWFRVEENKK